MTTFNLDRRIDRVIDFEGKSYRYFSGTAYLGIGLLPEFQERVIAGMEQYGLNHGQSRGNNVRLKIYEEFESFFAHSAGAESALVMSSGYLAGTAALRHLSDGVDQIWVAPDTHPAILPVDLTPNPEGSFEDWKENCLEKASTLSPQTILILGNAANPLTSDIHAYSWLEDIASKHDLRLLIDDSHAFGVIGNEHFGTYSSLSRIPAKVVVSGSIGKGLGLPAGIILSDEATKAEIMKLRIFGGASPCPPGFLQAFLDTQPLYQSQVQTLKKNIKYFHSGIQGIPEITGYESYPVFRFTQDSWVEKLEQAGFITSSFHYPTASDPRINRIVISAFHFQEDLDFLLQTLIQLSTSKT